MVINPLQATVRMRRNAIELLYTDLCDIDRKGQYTNPDTKLTEQAWVKISEKTPCRMSGASSSISELATHKESSTTMKIFIAPEVDLIEGDFITLIRNANSTGTPEVFLLVADKPVNFDTHKEVSCSERKGV